MFTRYGHENEHQRLMVTDN